MTFLGWHGVGAGAWVPSSGGGGGPSPPCSPGPPGNSRQAGEASRLVASWVNKFCLAYLKQCIEILCLAPEKTLGGLFWPRKNPGRAILAAEKLGRALFWLRKKQCARAHSGNLTYRLCIFDT